MNVYKMVVLKRFLIYDESFFLARSSESIKPTDIISLTDFF